MKEYGYIFKPQSILAMLAGIKTQTRRVPRPNNCLIDGKGRRQWPDLDWARAELPDVGSCWDEAPYDIGVHSELSLVVPEIGTNKYHEITPRAQSGDSIWAKETWALGCGYDDVQIKDLVPEPYIMKWYKATLLGDNSRRGRWRSPRYMPRWAARLVRPIKDVRFEWLQDLSYKDAIAEGIRPVTKDGDVTKYCIYDYPDHSLTPWQDMPMSPIPVFRNLWNSINANRGWAWELNLPVLRIEFKKGDE